MNLYKGVRATFLNHYSYFAVKSNLRNLLSFDLYGDGLLFVLQNRLMGLKTLASNKRVSFDFTSVADDCFNYCKINGLKVLIVGANISENRVALSIFKERYAYDNLYGIDGYQDDLTNILLSNNVNRSDTFLILGLGSPKQEELLLKLNKEKYHGIITCGGFISQTAISEGLYYPRFFDKFNLRWLYRLVKTDYVARRLLLIYPISIFRFAVKRFN